jgi:hypothetical protein
VKYLLPGLLLLFLFAGGGVGDASAQNSRRLSATPRAFQVFYTKFRKAVIARQKTAVVSMTAFPFQYGYDAGDEGTYTRAQFLKNYDKVLGRGQDIAIFRRTNPTFYSGDGRFELVDESNASHYTFEKKGASYRFAAYISEP